MKQLLLTLVTFLVTYFLYAQQQTVTGKVTDAKTGEPVAGVSIQVRASKAGTTTNDDGVFSIQAGANDILEISRVGYKTLSININGQSTININFESSAQELGQIVLVGSRRGGRVKTETAVPVDVVNVAQATLSTGRMDITSILNYAAPSFNYNKQSGSDGADHIDLATLRGLGPDQTLVLINGKRRHQTAFVAVFGTRGRGNSGTDLSAIPVAAIERVEILRDGASAQYGSDAIAGVINIILKKTTHEFTGNIGYSGYYDHRYNPFFKKEQGQYIYGKAIDGNAINFNGNYGLTLGKKGGFINFTGNFLRQGKTYRQALETDPSKSDFMYTNIYRRAHGDGSVTGGGIFYNAELPAGKGKTTLYSFGGYNYKASDAYAFTRNFSARPDRFPTQPNGDLIEVPGIIMTAIDGEKYFNPHIQTHIGDISVAAGVRGVSKDNWNWDVSNTTGNNNFHFYGDKTFNASKGASQTHFDDGGFALLQNTTNINFSKELFSNFNLAVGGEYRYERYKLFAGEEASYTNYDPNGDKATGSQGFPGYQPNDEVKADRSVLGFYLDGEMDVTKSFLLNGAVRVESYSDFGLTRNFKLATRLKATNNFNLRGSVSTGFRAPSLAQINFSSTFTTVQGGNIAEVKIAPNYSPITKAAGIPKLKQEKSTNVSMGFVWKPFKDVTLTVDGYWVRVKDRVVLSGQFSVDDNTLDPALINAMQNLNVSLAQFFANAVNTTNRGIDIVLENNNKTGVNSYFKWVFTGNFQEMKINKVNVPAKLSGTADLRATFFSDRERAFVLASAPKSKFAINLEYGKNKFSVGTRFTYFGKITLLGYGEDGLGINPMVPSDANANVYVPDQYFYNGKMVSDVYLGYQLSKKINLNIGADNVFNIHPDLGINPLARGWAFNNETGGPWDAVQMGGNGIRFFAKIGFKF
ncbi:MAG: TonB-dependent receptor [Terrimonas sp.]|nr:TonB-dependent receptor [Terrimonas sp.]